MTRLPAFVMAIPEDWIVYDDLRLNPGTRRAVLKDRELRLAKLEFDLLEWFMRNPDRPFTRDNLLNAVWPDEPARCSKRSGCDSTDRCVDAAVKRVREELRWYSGRIETLRGIGYRWVP